MWKYVDWRVDAFAGDSIAGDVDARTTLQAILHRKLRLFCVRT